MKIVEQKCELITKTKEEDICKMIEYCGRVAYLSFGKISRESYKEFINMLLQKQHLSVFEHISFTFKITTDRGISHELVRHRIASFTQESTRFCNYNNKDIEFISPFTFTEGKEEQVELFFQMIKQSEFVYKELINSGMSPQWARSVLPNSLKTELFMTANLRQIFHIVKLRISKQAHPQMQHLIHGMVAQLKVSYPIIFNSEYFNNEILCGREQHEFLS